MGDRFENWQPDPEWLAGMAEAEERHGSFSVGGLACDMGPALPRLPEARSAFTRFIDLARRQRKLTLEALAEAADIDLGELVGIMEDHAPPSTRAVYNIASVLEVPTRKLLELSGLADVRDAALAEAAVRFAARSEPTAALTREERRALDEFVKVLVENTDQPA
jgi:HTH-type transcriptional regulator, competence development regulator